jgi:hypothetical protein
MARIVVPSAEALTTALGQSSRDALVTLARALAEEVQATDDQAQRHTTIKLYLSVLRQVDLMDRAARTEARQMARSEAAMDWMARRDEERARTVAARVAEKMARESAPGPASSVIDELRQVRDKRRKRAA